MMARKSWPLEQPFKQPPKFRPIRWSIREIYEAIREVETGGHPDPANAVGDSGRSLGPYQISHPYWLDAVVYARKEPGRTTEPPWFLDYSSVRNREAAEEVMACYWKRYCPGAFVAGEAEVLSRVHQGGPQGHRRDATFSYWGKVKRILERNRKAKEVVG